MLRTLISIIGSIAFIATVAGTLGACGPKPAATTGTGGATAALPDVEFDDLNHEQRKQFMQEKVVPTMGPLFAQQDPAKFAEFGCPTCHGEGAAAGNFEMPNPKLPKLDFSDMSKYKPEMVEFMNKTVKPEMAKLLREPEATQDNPKGFGCLHCHEMAGK